MAQATSLSSGTKIGPYEIVGLIGSGGLGEVYRARDPRLQREVAVKVVRVGDSEAALKEARAAAMLDHPNILAIHDVGTHEGRPFVVTELLEGETLYARLHGGALPARKVVDLALQLGRGLVAAHDKGIVHRDLKPENLFLTGDGRLKILDFGLAKLTAGDGSGVATAATEPGAILGTVGYMAPEQVRGTPADHRSDLFSFGAILYEMVTGRRAFGEGTAVEVMSAILKEEPPAPSELQGVPAGLERLILHCLEKRPEARFQSTRDLVFDLETLAAGSLSSVTMRGAPTIRSGPRFAARVPWRAMAGAAALAVAVGAFFVGRRTAEVASPSYRQLTFRRGTIKGARFAPDGHTVVYGAAWEGRPIEIFEARPGSPEGRPLGLKDAQILAISPSGAMAVSLGHRPEGALVPGKGTLAEVPLGGGAPHPLLEGVHEADWGPDGTLAVTREGKGQWRLEYPIGTVIFETSGWVGQPKVSPDGKMVAFLDHPVPGDDQGSVAVIERGKGKRTLSRDFLTAQGLAWAKGGSELWFGAGGAGHGRSVQAVTLGGRERTLLTLPAWVAVQDVSREGKLLLTRESLRGVVMAKEPGAERERDLSWLDATVPVDISGDGKQMLMVEGGGEEAGPSYGLYLRPTDGGPAVRLGSGRPTALSPDGKWVMVVKHGNPGQLLRFPTGPGQPEAMAADAIDHYWGTWTPDGKRVVSVGTAPGKRPQLFVREVAGGAARAISPEGIRMDRALVSADGKWVGAVSAEGVLTLYPIDGGEPKAVAGAEPNEAPVVFSADGKSLFVQGSREPPTRVTRVDLATGERSPWKAIEPVDRAGVEIVGRVFMAPDTRAYVYSFARLLTDLYLVEGVR